MRFIWTAAIILCVLGITAASQEDRRTAAPGTASLSGRVRDDATGRPLAEATVTLFDTRQRALGQTQTGPDGTYLFAHVSAGLYRVVASHDGFVPQNLGGSSMLNDDNIDVAPGAHVGGLDFSLIRSATIQGRITDSLGHPLAKAPVQAVRITTDMGARVTAQAGSDENGAYRLERLPEGEYWLFAKGPSPARSAANPQPTAQYTATYFPGVSDPAQASVIRVRRGETISNIDISLPRIEFFGISGHVLRSDPGDGPVECYLVTSVPPSVRRISLTDEGAFTLSQLKSGRYIVWARARTQNGFEAAWQAVDLSGPLEGMLLAMTPARKIEGQIVTRRGDPLPTYGLRVAAVLIDGADEFDPTQRDQVAIAADGRFRIDGVFGERALRVIGLPAGWSVQDVQGAARRDDLFIIAPGARADDLRVIVAQQ